MKKLYIAFCFIFFFFSCIRDHDAQCGIVVNFMLYTTNNLEQNMVYADSYINKNSVDMFVYDMNGYLKDKAIIQKVTENNNNTYLVTAFLKNITYKDYNNEFKVVITANTNSAFCDMKIASTPITIKELYNSLIFNYSAKKDCTNELTEAIFLKDKVNGIIPFWGTCVVELVNNCSFDVALLRSLAKIKISGANKDVNIEKIELSGGIKKGYISPNNAWEMKKTSNYLNNDTNIPQYFDNGEILCTNFYKDGDIFYLYVPEQHAGESKINMLINGKNYSIFVGDLKTDVRWPIVRNTIYSYSINLKDSDTKSNRSIEIMSAVNSL